MPERTHVVSKKRPSLVLRMVLSSQHLPVRKLPFALLECASEASKTIHGIMRICAVVSCRMTKEMFSVLGKLTPLRSVCFKLNEICKPVMIASYIPFSLNPD